MRGRVPVLALWVALLRRPSLWPTAVGAGFAMARRRWWVRRPYVPAPSAPYVDWRIATAYGSPDGPVSVDDVVAYLAWRRRQRV